jgi:hypothetical protein
MMTRSTSTPINEHYYNESISTSYRADFGTPLTTLSEDETMFRASVREFAEGELRPRVEHMDEVAKLDPADHQAVF